MVKKAFIVGINYKGTNNELYGCINDAENMRNYLLSQGYTVIKLISDDTEEKPTKSNILNGLNWLVENSTENDSLFFHYSGHGTNTIDLSGDEIDGLDEAICPLDLMNYPSSSEGLIIDDDIYKIFNQAKGKIFCVFDCCHSGTIMDLKYNYKQINENIMNVVKCNNQGNNEKKDTSKTSPFILCISGCRDNQTSADTVMKNTPQGALSGILLEILNSRNKEYISYKTLMVELVKLMRERGYSQVPQFSSNIYLNLKDKWNV